MNNGKLLLNAGNSMARNAFGRARNANIVGDMDTVPGLNDG